MQKGHAWPISCSSTKQRGQPSCCPHYIPAIVCKELLRAAEPPQGAPSCCRKSSVPVGQMDRNSYFWLMFPLHMLMHILEHMIEKEPWIGGLVWLITPWAHNPPHKSKPHLLMNCPQLITVRCFSKVRSIDGSLPHSSLFSVIIS